MGWHIPPHSLSHSTHLSKAHHTRLDPSVLLGLGLGAIMVIGAFTWLGLPLRMLVQPEALLIVLGGTATALLMNFSSRTGTLLKTGIQNSLTKTTSTPHDAVDLLTQLAQLVRKNGLLSLQQVMDQIPSPFVQKGIQLMQDNRPPALVQHTLTTDMEVQYRQELDAARVFEAAGGFAPTLGIVGAVIGLMHVASAFDSPNELTHGIASAFTATLYGVGLANLICLPLAGRLKQQARDAWFQKTILTEGLMSIYAGDHPLVTEEKLRAFLSNVPMQGMTSGPAAFLPMEQLLSGVVPSAKGELNPASTASEPLARPNHTLRFDRHARHSVPQKTLRSSSSLANTPQDIDPPITNALPSAVFNGVNNRPKASFATSKSTHASKPNHTRLPQTPNGSSAANRLNHSGRFRDSVTPMVHASPPIRTHRQGLSSAELEQLAANDGWIE
ncbi:MAG: MotA/TolQ/ExbB proton channel family protein [Vampirovibrionales bacterium]